MRIRFWVPNTPEHQVQLLHLRRAIVRMGNDVFRVTRFRCVYGEVRADPVFVKLAARRLRNPDSVISAAQDPAELFEGAFSPLSPR